MAQRPSDKLFSELCEVATDAINLRNHLLRQSNVPLPHGFPVNFTVQICDALEHLPDATLSGAIHGLEVGRLRLPTLRTDYLPVKSDISDQHPDNERGGLLDGLLKSLIGSISSAIAQYEHDLSTLTDSGIVADISLSKKENRDLELDDFEKKSEAVDSLVSEVTTAIDPVIYAQNEIILVLRGEFTDSSIAVKITRAEASHPRPKATVFEKTGSWLSEKSDKILAVLSSAEYLFEPAIEAIARMLHREVDSFKSHLNNVTLALKDIAISARVISSRISEIFNKNRNPTEIPKDFDLSETHRLLAMNKLPPKEWIPFIKVLNFYRWENLSKISVFSELYALETLILNGTDVVDISPLSALVSLKTLDIIGTKVRDKSPLFHLEDMGLVIVGP